MILGVINPRLEATLPLEISVPAGQKRTITGIIDTGSNGDLSLPLIVVTALSLTPLAPGRVQLGDASHKISSFYRADVLWDGQIRPIRVLCVEGDPLVGTGLLRDYQLTADFVLDGHVLLRCQVDFRSYGHLTLCTSSVRPDQSGSSSMVKKRRRSSA